MPNITLSEMELRRRLLIAYRTGWNNCERRKADTITLTPAEILSSIEEERIEIEKWRENSEY